ncbi:MAG: ABC transporter permease [Deltaproteobacteria bacterium]|nr:ABC transporter permease [Deltaproteobacteria bacterium]
MIFRTQVRRSLGQFRTHPLRTSLALLGMVLGVGSVVGMMSIGEGAQQEIVANIEALGGNVIHIRAKDISDERVAELVNDSRGLSREDLRALRATFPHLGRAAWARISSLGVTDLPSTAYNAQIVAASPDLFDLHRLKVKEGRGLLELDDRMGRRVAVLGADLAKTAFGDVDGASVVGRRVRLGYAYFEIVGVLSAKASVRDLPLDPGLYNQAVIVPFSTALEEIAPADAYKEIDVLSIEVETLEQTLAAKHATAPVIRALHRGVEDFELVAPEEILQQKRATQAILNIVLISIAAISLLVGGIGVMNIMLANIMERISEIGLRRAIGASRSDIRDQFLVESVIICFAGGAFGVVFGYVISFAVGFIFDLNVAFAWEATLIAFALSVVTGLTFGLWPALRASAINPVEALLHD